MRKYFTNKLTFLLALSTFIMCFSVSAQTFSNEKIWGGEFRSDGVWGIRSMASGTHYTTSGLTEEEGSSINMYSYKSGEKVATRGTSL
jgi:hypothetical protein